MNNKQASSIEVGYFGDGVDVKNNHISLTWRDSSNPTNKIEVNFTPNYKPFEVKAVLDNLSKVLDGSNMYDLHRMASNSFGTAMEDKN